jgi:hypothetical protein
MNGNVSLTKVFAKDFLRFLATKTSEIGHETEIARNNWIYKLSPTKFGRLDIAFHKLS